MVKQSFRQRRKKLVEYLDRMIVQLGEFGERKPVGGKPFSIHRGLIHIQLRYGKRVFALPDGETVITAPSIEDAIDQLDQLKIIALAGGLDDALEAVGKSRSSLLS